MKALVVGASGFIGTHLVKALLARGDEVVATGRDEAKVAKNLGGGVRCIGWDTNSGPLPADALEGVDAVINLAGEPVAKRWTKARKQRIRDSRVFGTRNVVAGIEAAGVKPVLVNTSAIGYYGDGKHKMLHETASRGSGFLADVCFAWEAEARKARDLGLRVAILRVGVVLGKEGGAYPLMSMPVRMFFGGPIGMGRMWFSWIHIDDIVGIYLHLADTKADGVFNGTAPNPVTNEEFTKTLGSVLKRPTFMRVPQPALYVRFGEFASVICGSQNCPPLRTIAAGYEYKYPEVRAAIEDLR